MSERVLTVRQPWADLIMAGVKDVENRTWRVPSTLPHHYACAECGTREELDANGWFSAGCNHSRVVELVRDGPFPFRLWIHAAQREAQPDAPIPVTDEWEALPWYDGWVHRDAMPFGALLGFVTVTGCHHADVCGYGPLDGAGNYAGPESWCSPWAEDGAYHWTLTDPDPLDEPIPMSGALGLWRLPEGVVA